MGNVIMNSYQHLSPEERALIMRDLCINQPKATFYDGSINDVD
jgi:hypothetical protein